MVTAEQVKEARERSHLVNQINGLYGQANNLFHTSMQCRDNDRADLYWAQGQAVANAAEQLREDYYARFPNCMSRAVYAWAQ